VVVLIVAVLCTGWAHARIPNVSRAELGESFVPSPGVARALAFGFDALLADYHWLQAVQVVGGAETVDAPRARHVGKLVDVVTSLNPHVSHPYRFAAIWLTHDEALVREGIRLLQRSIEYHPDDWRNHFYLGFNHFYHLGEYEEAAQALEVAMALPGAPAYLPRLVARLRSHTQDIEVAEVFLRELLRGSSDGEGRAKIQAALDEIEIEYKARHLDRAREAYRALAGRDIESVEDLKRGPHRVLERLPSPEPDSIPPSLTRGSVWKLDAKSQRIVSSYLGSRYEVHFSSFDRQRKQQGRSRGEDRLEPTTEETKGEG
jgi:tetratricopeptide (TPR) repeat protein